MNITAATPYLLLAGKAREAAAFYERALGAKIQTIQTFGEAMSECPEATKDRVMHAELLLGGRALLLMSDGSTEGAAPKPEGISIALNFTSVEDGHRAFDALAEGGKVIEPLFEAPWGAVFGIVVDRFNISWMFNCEVKKG